MNQLEQNCLHEIRGGFGGDIDLVPYALGDGRTAEPVVRDNQSQSPLDDAYNRLDLTKYHGDIDHVWR